LGELEQELRAHHIVGVDTAPFIYLWERHPRYFSLSETLFQHLKQPDTQGVTSVITLIEACVLPQRQDRMDLVQAYERALLYSQQMRTLPIDVEMARHAVRLRARYGIRVPDARQISAAIQAEATAFVTDDRRLGQVGEIHVIVLDDYLD
jgi:predicted nucleic acid-binding protein